MERADESFTEAVIEVLDRLQPGEVMAYGEVAAEAGYPGAARAVGNLLRTTPGLPWWRIVTATGRLVPGNETEHAARLRSEGVGVARGRVARR
jgi:methylated-DNA-protein-cysteine methyltransferase-like protein